MCMPPVVKDNDNDLEAGNNLPNNNSAHPFNPSMANELFETYGEDPVFLEYLANEQGLVKASSSPSPSTAGVEKAVATGAMSKQASTITLKEDVNGSHPAFKNCTSKVISLVLNILSSLDRNKDGKITMDELLQGMVAVAVAALNSQRNTRLLSGLTVALLVISIGSVFTAVYLSKDTSVSNGMFTAKGSALPLETAVHSTQIHLGQPAGLVLPTDEESDATAPQGNKMKILGCLTPEDIEAMKLGSLSSPATLTTESGGIHTLQTHDWEEDEVGSIKITDTSGVHFEIKKDPSCSTQIKHGRRLRQSRYSFFSSF